MNWINAFFRSLVWVGGAVFYAYLKTRGAGLLSIRTDAIGWLGVCLLTAGLILHLWSNIELARHDDAEALAVSATYALVRNPIYLAGLSLLAGAGLIYSPWGFAEAVFLLFMFIFFHVRVIYFEEPSLRKAYGERYEEYCRRVPRWLPALWPRSH